MSTCNSYWNNLLNVTDSDGTPIEWNPTFYTSPDCGYGAAGKTTKLNVRPTGSTSAKYFPYRNDMTNFDYYEDPNHTVAFTLGNLSNSVSGIGANTTQPYLSGNYNGYGSSTVNIDKDIDSYIVPPNMSVKLGSDTWFNGPSTNAIGGGFVEILSNDARFGIIGGSNKARSLELKRDGSMADWTRACCMRDTGNTQFKTVNQQSCGAYWGSGDKCDAVMAKHCAKTENAKSQSCRCLSNNQDPALPDNVDPQIRSLISGMPQCTKICSGFDPTIYKPSTLKPCTANLNVQVTNCTQNTNIQGADNLISGSNISLECKPNQITGGNSSGNDITTDTPTGTEDGASITDFIQKYMLIIILVLVIVIGAFVYFMSDDDDDRSSYRNSDDRNSKTRNDDEDEDDE